MKLDLYIEDQIVDLFSDETITLTSSIQDIRDISKIFSDFTKKFNVPASKLNNKIFRHFYNIDITNNDLRIKVQAELKLNGLPYKKGRVKINGVRMKDNEAVSYSITFFGNTVGLKDILGSDEIEYLPLTYFDHQFNDSIVKGGLTGSITTNKDSQAITAGDIIYPLNTYDKRLVYDTSATTYTELENIDYKTTGQTNGINYLDLKPAIRVLKLIEAIEEKYTVANGYPTDIVFSTDFFDSSNSAMSDLYLWLHKFEGRVGSGEDGFATPSRVISGFSHTSGDVIVSLDTNGTEIGFTTYEDSHNGSDRTTVDLEITPLGVAKYNIVLEDTVTGTILGQWANLSGVQTVQYPAVGGTFGNNRVWSVKATASTDDGLISFSAQWDVQRKITDIFSIVTTDEVLNAASQSFVSLAIISENIPKMKVLDLLTSLFKMFNLTAYEEDGVLVVDTLNNYYAAGVDRDITKYVDIKTSDINSSQIHKKISFEYEPPATFLAHSYNNLNNTTYGDLEYTTKFEGKDYKIKIPFEKVLYERLSDVNSGTLTNVQYGYFVDDKQDPLVANPLLFHNINTATGSTYTIAYLDSGVAEGLTTYNRPANLKGTDSLNFGTDIDEYTQAPTAETSTLFYKYYQDYITSIFDVQQRITLVTANFPVGFLITYTAADTLIIANRRYKINSTKVNLQNGITKLTLLHDV